MFKALWLLSILFVYGLSLCAAEFGENLIELNLALPKGDTYLRGSIDPVADLVAEITLTNRSKKEDFSIKTEVVPTASRLSPMESEQLIGMSREEQAKFIENKKGSKVVEIVPVNNNSIGFSYVEPQLGTHDNIDFLITRVPEEGEAIAESKLTPIARDTKAEQSSHTDLVAGKYLAAGETSPAYVLPVGKYFLIREPGVYSIKAIFRLIGDSAKPLKYLESNEEKFRVLPFKIINAKITGLQREWEYYEHGTPSFDYMLYQVKTTGLFDEVYYVQRIKVRGMDHWEWARLCSVMASTQVQVAQLAPKKVAVLTVHAKGDAGLYTLDFTRVAPAVTAEILALKDGALPKLKVEAGKVSAE